MSWSTYVGAIHLEGRQWFFLERIDDYHLQSADNGILRDASGRLVVYETEAAARATALELAEPLRDKPPFLVDVDAALEWCAAPKVDTLDPRLVMLTWHTLIDFGVCEQFPDATLPEEEGYELGSIVDKVHEAHAATVVPGIDWPEPEWSFAEVSLLAETLKAGIARLRDEIIPSIDQQ